VTQGLLLDSKKRKHLAAMARCFASGSFSTDLVEAGKLVQGVVDL
jgi:hypothetical protein